MSDTSPLNDPALLWILGGICGCLAVIFVWIYYHSIRDARVRAKQAELVQEVGHQTIRGSIMERLHRHSRQIRKVMQALGMDDK